MPATQVGSRAVRTPLVAALVVVALAGCGDDESESAALSAAEADRLTGIQQAGCARPGGMHAGLRRAVF